MIIYLASYPRSGNTWVRHLVRHYFGYRSASVYPEPGGAPNLEVRADGSFDTFSYYQFAGPPAAQLPMLVNNCGSLLTPELRKQLAAMPEPLFIKTHELPFKRYGDGEYVVYIVREPGAVVWSYYTYLHKNEAAQFANLTLDEVIKGRVPFGSWSEHISSWQKAGAQLGPRFLLYTYEDLTAQPETAFCDQLAVLTGLGYHPPKNPLPSVSQWHQQAPTLYRKEQESNWRAHISETQRANIWKQHGKVMRVFGYTEDGQPATRSQQSAVGSQQLAVSSQQSAVASQAPSNTTSQVDVAIVNGQSSAAEAALRIVLTEYPKAGGSWVVSMLGHALNLPKRDIAVTNGTTRADIARHPWYADSTDYGLPAACVIKSHELPGSPLTAFPARFAHLVRDGRDVVVSKYFYEKEFCVQNGIYESFDTPFDAYLPKVAQEWSDYVLAWLDSGVPFYRYEDFLRDPERTLATLLAELQLEVTPEQVRAAVAANTKEQFSRAFDQAYSHNTFVRRGVAGDWQNHFSDKHTRMFSRLAGAALERLGYPQSPGTQRSLHQGAGQPLADTAIPTANAAESPAAASEILVGDHAPCWCGGTRFVAFSPTYLRCLSCETLVVKDMPGPEIAQVHDDQHDFYGRDYWFTHMEQDLGQTTIVERARSDLPERVLHWMRTILAHKLPGGRALDIGCAHGGLVAMLRWAGFDASGLELSPAIVAFAQKTFDIPMLQGPIEQQPIAAGSLDVITLMDVLEHLPDPLGTVRHCLTLLKPNGLLIIQTPKFVVGKTHAAMVAGADRFLEQLRTEQHLYLFSQQSLQLLFERLGVGHAAFEPPMFEHYDMFCVASRAALEQHSHEAIVAALTSQPSGRMVLALLDLKEAYRELEQCYRIAEDDRQGRLAVIQRQGNELGRIPALEADIAFLKNQIGELEADRAARLAVIERQSGDQGQIARLEADVAFLKRQVTDLDADRTARLAVIERQGSELGRIPALEAAIQQQASELGTQRQRLGQLGQHLATARQLLGSRTGRLLKLVRPVWYGQLQAALTQGGTSAPAPAAPVNTQPVANTGGIDIATYTAQIDAFNRGQPNRALLDAIRAYNHTMVSQFNQIVPLRGRRLLDIGASPHGYALEQALQLGVAEYIGIGLDVEQPVAVRSPTGHAQLLAMDATQLSFADNSFDLVISLSTFEHINDVPRALHEIRRVLKDGGSALISFEPVWTCAYGHHLHHFGPVASLMPDWAHLVWDKPTMLRELAASWPADAPLTLDQAAEWVYDSTAINRIGIGQMRQMFQQAGLQIEWMTGLEDSNRDTARLQMIAKQVGVAASDLMAKGLSVLLRKQPATPAATVAPTVPTPADTQPEAEFFAQIRAPKAWKVVAYTPQTLDDTVARLQQQGFRVEDLTLDPQAYRDYFATVDYPGRYPYYYSFNLPEKSLEHFVAAQLLALKPGDVYIDIASEHSPVPEIYATQFGCVTYRQDLAYPAGLHGDQIGGDAAAMPVPDGFTDTMALHCSFEHFEGDADIRFMRETARVLKPGGRLCIVPLYVFNEFVNQAGPKAAIEKQTVFDAGATVYAKAGWRHNFARYYDPEHLYQRVRASAPGLDIVIYRVTNARAIDPSCYMKFVLLATKPG